MSRGQPYEPVCSKTITNQAASPTTVIAVSVAFDPNCRLLTGTQTATPDLAE